MTSEQRALRDRGGLIGRWAYVAILACIAMVLAIGGIQLILLGGSAYFAIAGLILLASAAFTALRSYLGAWLYGVMLVISVAWAIAENGFDGWALAGRLIAPLVLGIGFMLLRPGAERLVVHSRQPAWMRGWRGMGLGLIGAIIVGAWIFQRTPVVADPMLQVGTQTTFPAAIDAPANDGDSGDWLHYGNDAAGTRYSPLAQLTPANVDQLKVAWTVDLGPGPDGRITQLEVTPLKVGNRLYACTAYNDVLAIDAENGRTVWRFRSGNKLKSTTHAACRGVAYYRVPNESGPCAERIITNTTDARLIALDAATGMKCPGFGTKGETSLRTGMGEMLDGYYYVSSAPTIIRGKIVLGGWVADGQYWGEPSGVIRAYDAVTGKFAWAFDMGRPGQTGEPGAGQTYTLSTPNSWAPMSADERLGLVYAPTGNATPDYFGGQRRPFDEKYTASVVALDAETGLVRWSFQTVHHDLWDYDVASQPTLADIPTASGTVRHALLAPTKRGELFMLDRATGRPLSPVVEQKVPGPKGPTIVGERYAPTQPFSVGLPSFRPADLREQDMWGITPLDQLWCRLRFREARYEGSMTPPGLQPTVVYPGYLGGMNWGGVSIDKAHGIAVVNSSFIANYDQMVTRAEADRQGVVPLGHAGGKVVDLGGTAPQEKTPYATRVQPFLSPLGVPCNKPPFGKLSAIDLRTRKLLWSQPIGTARDSGPFGLSMKLPIPMGLPMSGGTVTTAGGLIFMGATAEATFRAIDLKTGRQLWSARLPAGGHATPMTYISPASGRQFVVIAAGGSIAMRSKLGTKIVAYSLPKAAR